MERDKYMASFPEILIEIPVRMRATMDGWLYGWMDGWMDGCMDQSTFSPSTLSVSINPNNNI